MEFKLNNFFFKVSKKKFFNFISCNFLVRTLQYLKKKFKHFFDPQNKKKSPKKLLIIPLDHQFSVQQVFALWSWDSFKVWNFLIFEVVKLCRMKKYLKISYDAGTIALHYVVLNYLYSAFHENKRFLLCPSEQSIF